MWEAKDGMNMQAARRQRMREIAMRLWQREQELRLGAGVVAGVDEAGRGCLAGPVVCAAVVLDGPPERWIGIHDSKALRKAQREEMYAYILRHARQVSVAYATAGEIDQWNILEASRLAMGRALQGLHGVEVALVDGPHVPAQVPAGVRVVPVVDGDATCLSIAAASIVAKVVRDRHMARLGERYAVYGFAQNAGYATPDHLRALAAYGVCPEHRRSFAPVQRVLRGEPRREQQAYAGSGRGQPRPLTHSGFAPCADPLL
ncbi:hypothetical protein GCM10010885_00560 [Alicyclobacillus cellulosilyticus]|uniref:Ribonuclease HII n=2 Tax=Alicyclobacillus cellulosilyticus TaxID=1003997 RepID=A0A917NG45_9BACL|nr:hypothetical protein GCM10010885_00560 [Alicyclobacillus cellulosilyticus]